MKKQRGKSRSFRVKFSPEIVYYTTPEDEKERLFFLMLKGLCFSLLSNGLMGGFLSAMDLPYNSGLVMIVFLVSGIFLSSMYITPMVRDVGYVVFFGCFVSFSLRYKAYINSGFYAAVNEINQEFIEYFSLPGGNEYSESFSNRYVTVTYMVIFLGIIDLILMNIATLSGIRCLSFALQCVLVWAIPAYLGKTPGMWYVISTVTALFALVMLRYGDHSRSSRLKWKDREYKYNYFGKVRTSRGRRMAVFDYQNSYRLFARFLLFSLGFVLCFLGEIQMFMPHGSWNRLEQSQLRKKADQGVFQVFRYGLEGSFWGSSAGGGIGKGKLGGNSGVRPSYETHLRVTFAPYSLERLYLRGYTGVIYEDNQWTEYDYSDKNSEDSEYSWRLREELLYQEGVGKQEAFQQRKEDSKLAKAKMIVENVKAEEEFLYTPYYTFMKEDEYKRRGGKVSFPQSTSYIYEYYPLQSLKLKDSVEAYNGREKKESAFVEDCYLQIPQKNKAVIEKVCEEMKLTGNLQKKITTLQQYFQDNYPYTTRPGKVPMGKDAINYFLTENKKGYCAYYASAATLIFRNLGIPARYVEGYAVDYTQFAEADFVHGAEYSEFYQGYSSLGETGVVQVDVSDACAHAWVEIYLKDFGWFPVEVTPADSGEQEDFWSLFGNIFQRADTGFGTVDEDTGKSGVLKVNGKMLWIFLGGVFFMIAIIVYYPRTKRYFDTHGKDSRDNLFAQYHQMWELAKKKNSHEDLSIYLTYEEQLGFLTEKYPELIGREYAQKLIEKLEIMGFSNQRFTEDEMKQVQNEIRELKKKIHNLKKM